MEIKIDENGKEIAEITLDELFGGIEMDIVNETEETNTEEEVEDEEKNITNNS